MADASNKAGAKLRNRQWRETELKYFALVLPDKKQEFGYKLDTLVTRSISTPPWMGCQSIAGLPPALSSLLPI